MLNGLAVRCRFVEFRTSAPPNACDRCREYAYYRRRGQRRARIHVPRPFLGTPQRILDDGMEACSPQQERSRPRKIGIELVVQGASAKHPDSQGGEHGRHDESRRDSSGNLFLIARLIPNHTQECAWTAPRRLHPDGAGEPVQEAHMRGQQAKGKWPGEERRFGYKAPVDRPLVEELAGQFKSPSKVGGRSFAKGVAVANLRSQLASMSSDVNPWNTP